MRKTIAACFTVAVALASSPLWAADPGMQLDTLAVPTLQAASTTMPPARSPLPPLPWFDGQPNFNGVEDVFKFILWPMVGQVGYEHWDIWGGSSCVSFEGDGTGEGDAYQMGFRFGKMWNEHLEVMLEPIPVFVLDQKNGTNFAWGLYWGMRVYLNEYNPHELWVPNPYAELLGGFLQSVRKMPEEGSVFSWSWTGGIGIKTFVADQWSVDLGMRFLHISDAYMAEENPVRDGLLFYTGVSYTW
jgi:opacity protein-like surface antigen